MNSIKLLDCTLRDGGYVNNWEFGYDGIKNIITLLEKSGANILELGFMRDEAYKNDRAIYNSIEQIADVIGEKKEGVIYAALIEMANYFPLEKLAEQNGTGPDAIRYSFWKRKIDEAYEYSKQIVDKGYKLCVQPTRVEQYSEKEFAKMVEMFSKLQPYAIYIVDTFGLLKKRDLLKYAKIADEYLPKDIILGYHAHNNMQQAFSNATAFVELELDRTVMLDASVYGMGRGAGNLNMEMIMTYLNDGYNTSYDVSQIFKCWDQNIGKIYKSEKWGYSLPFFMAASMELNPNYPFFYSKKTDLSVCDMQKIFELIKGADKYLYNDEKAEKFYNIYKG